MKRTPRPVQLALAERLHHLDASAWDALTRDAGVFLQRPFLQAFEAAAPANVSPRYALMYLGDEPVAALHLQLVRIAGRSALSSAAPLAGMAQLVDERALVLGNLAAWGQTGLALAPGVDPALVWREALQLVDRLRRFEKHEGVVNVALVKDAGPADDEASLRRQGFQRAPQGPDMQLAVQPGWRTLDDYLASLASKRRRAVKKVFEDIAAAGYRARRLDVTDLERHETRLEALYGQVWESAEVRPLRLSGRFFVELQRRLGDDCVITGLERDGRLDGFGVSLRSGDTSIGYYLGFDKTVAAPLYLRLLVAILEAGLAFGATRISMGRTAEEPKARLGAEPGPSALWLKHRTPPLNWAVGAVLGSLEAPRIPAHKVFRDEQVSQKSADGC
ncbi:MAG: GNAT family N-acetyltransferase [Myxococcota bacterium]